MAPLKLEDNMKERLEKRSIEPTAAAWDRIERKLNAQEGKKKNKRVLWMAIAASFIGGVFITLLLLNNSNENVTTDQLVETPQFKDEIKIEELVIPDAEIQEDRDVENEELVEVVQKNSSDEIVEVASVDSNKKENKKSAVEHSDQNESHKAPSSKLLLIEEKTAVASRIPEGNVKEKKALIQKPLDKVIQNEIEGIVAKVDLETVTDEEIDALLLRAQRDIVSKQLFNSKTNKVDANALLLDVEAEVDPATFRDKVYDALKGGLLKARDAVADRNN